MKKEGRLTAKDYLKSLGPGAIMAAAIIGPGTITTASTQGASYGYESLWLILIACVIAYFFQEPGTRIALGCGEDVMVGIREHLGKGWAVFLYIVILVGSIAFQAGNLSGASMALTYFFPHTSVLLWAIIVSAVALAVILMRRYGVIENINQILIVLMVIAFVVTAFTSHANWGKAAAEGFSFRIPGGNAVLALSLLATTVTPNLVLGYSAFLRKKYTAGKYDVSREIHLNNFGLGFNMAVSFLITASIIICSGTLLHPQGIKIKSAGEMALQLVPILGKFAGVFFSVGLFAAAFSSVIYQISLHNMLLPKAFHVSEDPKAKHNLGVTLLVFIVPLIIIAALGSSPTQLIITAQALNGIALPLVFILCWVLCNKKAFMGKYVNTKVQNIIFGVVTALTVLFSLNTFINSIIPKLMA
ncbi:MAG: Nramp family divalent metal transporter [Lachnospiraceae bacterium]|jgi:NRAMP (natural resistance-associated macrophage protein)-like metal ion transporter|nr:Nramp family divalent metal transporter [Lachnospiraceae bacterium]MCI1328417.1 Nramp family divalent metal transporter [Lachnospiraceae bacterium]